MTTEESNIEWDNKMAAHTESIKEAQLSFIDTFLAEIKAHKYTEMYHVEGALNNHKERLGGGDE